MRNNNAAILQSGNLFAYCANNPVMWSDPTGLFFPNPNSTPDCSYPSNTGVLTPSKNSTGTSSSTYMPRYADKPASSLSEGPQPSGVFVPFEYDRDAAVAYAFRWQQPYRNPAFPDYKERNCANFVSQTLHAGGIPMAGEWSSRKRWHGHIASRAWTKASTNFEHVSTRFGRATHHVSSSDIADLAKGGTVRPGDVIYFSESSKSKDIYHSAVIVKVEDGEIFYLHNSGPPGLRAASRAGGDNIFVVEIADRGSVHVFTG
jgi:hypothetical protein